MNGRETRHSALLVALCIAALSSLAGACHPRPPAEWVGANVLELPPLGDEDASAAEILYRGHTFVLHAQNDWYVQEQVHEVRRINDASGLWWADVQFWVGDWERLVDFRARSISPDGTIREIDESDLRFDDGNEDADYERVSFRFPGVEVGSIVEFIYTLEADDRYTSWEERVVNDKIPVRRYRTTFRGTSDYLHRFEAFNAPQGAVTRGSSGLGWQVSFAVDDVAPWSREPHGPSEERGRVWWTYKTRSIGDLKVKRSWASELKAKSRLFYKDAPWLDGFADPWRVPADCGGLDCVATVLARTHEDTELESHQIWKDIRPLNDVLDARRVTTAEKAALLHARLSAAGLEARYAYHTSAHNGLFDVETPDLDYFDNILLYLPEQPGLSDDLWIDPTCEWCGAGELPAGLDRNRAVIFRRKNGDQVAALPKTPSGHWRPEPTTTRRSRLELDALGRAMVTDVITTTEGSAASILRATRDVKSEWYVKWLDAALADYPGRSDLQSDYDCDRLAGRCVQTRAFTLPHYAVVDGDTLYVPLSLLDSPLESSFGATKRNYPVFFPRWSLQHTLEIVPPDGMEVAGLPDATQITAGRGAIAASLDVTPATEEHPLRVSWQMSLDEAEHAPEDYAEVRNAMRMLVPLRSKTVTWTRPVSDEL